MMKTTVVNGIARAEGLYGPLKFEKTSYDERGFYVVEYIPNITAQNYRYFQNNMRSYRYFYDKNGGDVMMIAEITIYSDKSHSVKRYYTDKGYHKTVSIFEKSSNSYGLKENNFDVNDVVINSTTLNQIMSKINFSFEQDGQKQVSDDGQYVTVRYKNSSLIKPLITYTKSGDVTQIIFIMPISNVINIWQELIRKFGTKYEDGNEVVKRGQLTYLAKENSDNVGILGIYIE